MSAKNRARKSTGARSSPNIASLPTNATNRTLRQRPSQVTNSTTQGDSSDSDVPTQQLRNKNQNSTTSSIQSSSMLSSQASTSRDNAVDSDDDEQTTLRLSHGRRFGRIQAPGSSSESSSDSDEAPGRIKLTTRKVIPNKKRKIVQRKKSSSDSEEDVQPSPSSSRTSTSLTSRSVSSVPSSVVSSSNKTTSRGISSLVNKCVYYLLIANQKKYPIKRTDIQKHVFTAPERKCYAEVLKEAGDILKKTYGMEIIVSEKRKGEYMLINILSHDLGIQEFNDYSPVELQKRGFIFYILTIIFMNEQSITEDELNAALKPLGIDLNARTPHPIFGDVRSYMTKELVKQNYLEHKCINKEPPQYEFTWGERAYQEVDKKDLLEFFCQVTGDTRPEDWILQYNDAMSRRQEPA